MVHLDNLEYLIFRDCSQAWNNTIGDSNYAELAKEYLLDEGTIPSQTSATAVGTQSTYGVNCTCSLSTTASYSMFSASSTRSLSTTASCSMSSASSTSSLPVTNC